MFYSGENYSLPLDLKRHKLVFGRGVVSSDQSINMWDSSNFGKKPITFSIVS